MEKYADLIHFPALIAIRKAFEDFNAALADAGRDIGLDLEVTETVVTLYGEAYAAVGYLDGEVFVEPRFNIVRDISDR